MRAAPKTKVRLARDTDIKAIRQINIWIRRCRMNKDVQRRAFRNRDAAKLKGLKGFARGPGGGGTGSDDLFNRTRDVILIAT